MSAQITPLPDPGKGKPAAEAKAARRANWKRPRTKAEREAKREARVANVNAAMGRESS